MTAHAKVKEAGMLHPAIPRTSITPLLACSALAATLLALAPGAAHADDSFYVQKAVHVRVADPGAANAADAAVLYARLREASRRVCDNGATIDYDCAQRALSGAVQTLDLPEVTRLHQRRTGTAAGRTGA
jgi:UrcA family protein